MMRVGGLARRFASSAVFLAASFSACCCLVWRPRCLYVTMPPVAWVASSGVFSLARRALLVRGRLFLVVMTVGGVGRLFWLVLGCQAGLAVVSVF